ncbi:uncharacterized protein LOC111325590 isoform X1 [Stylophora pistillata]|nr:uncharacterized protein LOC111325590 isoform X1 [Stylophora pistillata]
MEGTLPPPELFTANLEEELEELLAKLNRQRCEGSSSLPDNTFEINLIQLLEKLKKKKMEVTMYPTIRSGLEKFDVSLPKELQSYVSYLSNGSAKLGLRRRVLRSPSAVKDFLEAMDEHELKTFLTIHIREGAWQVVLLFTDELPSDKLPRDWFDEMWDRHKGKETVGSSLYSSTSGILKAWPTEYDPDLVTLCKAITNWDWKVTRLILSGSRISDEGLKNLSTALTQSELYSLALCANNLQSQGLKHLCEALISGNCDLISLSVTRNGLGEEGIMHLCDVLTSNNCKLNSLNVSQNFFGNEGIKLLCDALISANCTLTSLKASWNVLGDEGIMPLARALTNKNCALTSLDISFNRIGDEGTKFLCKALTDTNCKLRSLNLHGNLKITDVGKQCLSEAITGTDWEVREGLILSLSIKSEVQ